MVRRNVVLSIFCLLLVSLLAVTPGLAKPPKKNNNKVVGIRWEFTGKKVVNGNQMAEIISDTFRVNNYNVFRGARKVGVVQPNGATETTLTITDFPKLNGTVTLRKVDTKPPVWKGQLEQSDGTKWLMTVTIRQK